MGILNLTPDSFYAGSRAKADEALSRIQALFAEGADVVDLGACSTRPGSPQPSLEEEWRRLEPVLLEIAGYSPLGACAPPHSGRGRGPLDTSPGGAQETMGGAGAERSKAESPRGESPAISIDTYRSEIVRRAYDIIGPFIVNDISGGQMDPRMLETVGRLGLPYVAMHMRGTPETMQSLTDYDDVVRAVIDYFKEFAIKAQDAGVAEWLPDPGFGFSKTLEQNYALLNRLDEVTSAFPERETLVGLSRKSMVYKALGITPEEAMPATQVVQFKALEKGARWLRVHDVAAAVQTARLYSTMNTSSPGAAK
ncbi:MAG: dihydropteroate synthase [Bacteroidales bacterium]|nr:dihydropteroate synthase [Bacteroidales bacterium]